MIKKLSESYGIALKAAKFASEKKAINIKILDISNISIISDYFIIASGNSTTQVKAISENIDKKLKEENIGIYRKEGFRKAQWVLMDYGDVVVHIFLKEKRDFYNLEDIWGDALVEDYSY